MDVQKAAANANNANNTASQRATGVFETGRTFAAQFADMMRVPMGATADLFPSNAKDHAAEPERAREPAQRADTREDDDADSSADNKAVATRDVREEPTKSDRQGDDNDGDHASDQGSEQRADNSDEDTHGKRDDAPSRDANADEHANNDDGGVQSAENSAGDDNVGDSEAANPQDANAQSASDNAKNNTEFTAALDGLIAAAQGSHQDQSVKSTAQTLRDAAGATQSTKAGETNANTIQNQGPGIASQGIAKDAGTADQSAQALRNMTHASAGLSKAENEAARAADQPLADLQARMLADKLKSDTPVKVQVNVDKSMGQTTSQTSQSLNANAIAAQEGDNAASARNAAQQPSLRATPQQVAQNGADAQIGAQGQTQAAAQLAGAAQSAAAERGMTRATTQVNTAGQHSAQVGVDAANATTPGANSATQQTAATQRAQQTQAPRAAQQHTPLTQLISVNITKAIAEGMDRISVQLRPAELGKVEVQLEVAKNGRVSATIIAERPESLELLRNDAKNLERALQEAGLDAHAGDLNFSLKDQQENPGDSNSGSRTADGEDDTQDGDAEAQMAARLLNGESLDIISDTRVDIRA